MHNKNHNNKSNALLKFTSPKRIYRVSSLGIAHPTITASVRSRCTPNSLVSVIENVAESSQSRCYSEPQPSRHIYL